MYLRIRPRRTGAILVLAALLLIVIIGMAAFSIDMGYMITVKSQLQNAADAAALAGAEELMQSYAQYNAPNQSQSQQVQIRKQAMANATATAEKVAALNQAGDVTSLTVLDADVVCGYLDSKGSFKKTPPDSHYPNTVQVTVRRDSQANTPLSLFFAPIFGMSSMNLTTMAQATVMENPTTFPDSKGIAGKFLPVALDVRVWQQFIQNGTSSSALNQVLAGLNGLPQLQVYPDGGPFGSFGLVSIGPAASDAPSYRDWIENGPSAQDLAYLTKQQLLPVSPQNPQEWSAGPGMKSTLQSNFADIIGQPRLIPLYDGTLPPTGSGYPIVGFAGVTVSQATGSGSNMNISVQPTLVIDPTGANGSPAGSAGLPPTFAFTPPQLTK